MLEHMVLLYTRTGLGDCPAELYAKWGGKSEHAPAYGEDTGSG